MDSRKVATSAVAVVAVVAAVGSFEHQRFVAEMAGEEWRSWLFPLSVDGMLVASTLVAWRAKQRGERVAGMTITSLFVGLVISVGANVLAPSLRESVPEWLPAAVAAWPPLALALAFEELLRLRSAPAEVRTAEVADPVEPEPAPEAVPPDAEQEARDLIRSGTALSGASLGRKFGQSEQWGRLQIQAVTEELTRTVSAVQ